MQHSSVKPRQGKGKRTSNLKYGYQSVKATERNPRVFTADFENSDPLPHKKQSGYNQSKTDLNFDSRHIDTDKNVNISSKKKLSNDDFRGAKAKKRILEIDVNSPENTFEDFAKNKKNKSS